MGTPDFALACLKALDASHHSVAAVVTQPDRAKGRGGRVVFSPVKEYALARGLDILQPEKIRGAENILATFDADAIVVAAYGQILPQALLDLTKHGAINVHASLLPKYRGASPIQQAILCGETVTGITIMQMDRGMDTGDMLLKKKVCIESSDTGGSLNDKLCQAAPGVLLEALEQIEAGKIAAVPQDNSQASYAPLITKDMARIRWDNSPACVVNQVRGYNPTPAAFAELGGQLIKIWRVEAVGFAADNPGTVIKACPKDGIFVAVRGGVVRIAELTPAGGKKMASQDFVRGYKIGAGDLFL